MKRLYFPPPLQMVTTATLMWGIDRLLPAFRVILPGMREMGLVLIALGILIELIAVFSFVRARTTVNPIEPAKASALVTGGLYRISRNPMYLGLLILLTGFALRLGNVLNVGVLALFVGLITVLQIKPEEAILEEKFGEAYTAYRKRVRRWI